jgi:phosphate acetyltransferase
VNFRRGLLERAAQRGARVVLCEGDDPRVQAAVERLRAERVVEPIVLGGDGIDPAKDPRLGKIASFLRERRPDRIRDGVHALDMAAEPVNFGAALVALGEADAAVAGAVGPTRETIRAALWANGTGSEPRELGLLHGDGG